MLSSVLTNLMCRFAPLLKPRVIPCCSRWDHELTGLLENGGFEIEPATFLYQSLVTSTTAISSRRILGANDRISIGMIGCGTRNLLEEVLQFSQDTNVEVTAVCDTWRQQREKAVAMVREASGKEPQQYVHYQDLLAIKEVDAVVIGPRIINIAGC